MNNNSGVALLKQRVLCISVTAALSLAASHNTHADIYNFTFSQPPCLAIPSPSPTVGCAVDDSSWLDRGVDGVDADTAIDESTDAFFTMLQSNGGPLQNSSEPYQSFHYYWFGIRTPIGGNVTIDTANGTGAASINGFDFFASGPAVASSITMVDVGNGDGNPASGDLWLANMLFSWNGNNGIPVSIVWNMSGLVTSLSGLNVNNLAAPANSISGGTGVGVVPASNNMVDTIPGQTDHTTQVGEVLIATSTLNTTPLCVPQQTTAPYHTPAETPPGCMTVTPSGALPLLVDGASNTNTGTTGVGGSPMIDGPFGAFNANFDFKRLVLAGYNDTTAPVVTLGATTVTVALNGTINTSNPGVSVTCADNADGNDNLTASAGTNANISFNVTGTVNTAVEGNYSVTYTCTDNAGARTALADNPNIAGVQATVPANNTSANAVLTVVVSDVDRPVITVLGANPLTHEACTAYTDPGATATDLQDGTLTSSIVVTGSTINALTNEGNYSKIYNVTDSGTGNPGSTPLAAIQQTRAVNVVDTVAPVLTVTGGTLVSGYKEFTIESTACAGFTKPTATVVDANSNCNAPGSATASSSDAVTCTVPDGQDSLSSTLSYSASDSAGTPNLGITHATIIVQRSEPVITLNGGGVVLNVGGLYTEQGMDVHDVQDGDVNNVTATGSSLGLTYTITSNVNSAVAGNYTVTYNATDSDTNTATQVTRSVTVGAFATGSNFTMLNPVGDTFGGTNDVVMDWDESLNTDAASTNFNMTITSALPEPFFSYVWTAHHVRVFGPGTYTFDTTCTTAQLEAGTSACNNPLAGSQTVRFLTMTVGAGQVGVHILFDWHGNNNIDVVNVWDQNAVWNDPDGTSVVKNNLFSGDAGCAPDPSALWDLVSTDADGNGIVGVPMIDGPFIGYSANFSANPSVSTCGDVIVVMTAPDTKLGSGSISIGMLLMSLFSLISFGVYRKIKK